MTDPPNIDPRFLGKLLLIQTTLHAIPTTEGVADFVCRGLQDMPAISCVAVRLGDRTHASDPAFKTRASALNAAEHRKDDGLVTIAVRTLHESYGDIILEAHDPLPLEAYRPFLESLANTVALTIENRNSEQSLKRMNETLEAAVQERTKELLTANAALRNNEERYRLIFQFSPLPMWVYDRDTLRFLTVNEAAVKSYGFSEEEFLGMSIRDIRPPEDVPALETLVRNIRPGSVHTGPWRHRKKNGTIISVSVHSHNVELHGRQARLVLAEDITERMRADAALQQSKDFTELLYRISKAFLTIRSEEDVFADVLREVLGFMDSPYGVFGYLNRRGDLVCPSMTRDIWSQCQMEKKSIVFPRESWGNSIWGHGLRTGESGYANSLFTVPEGHVQIDRCLTVPLLFHDRPIGILTVANKLRDYTDDDLQSLRRVGEHIAPILNAILDRHHANEDREKLQSQLLQAQKMEAIGQLAGGIAHDFNNILSAIVGYSSIMQMKLQRNDPAWAYTEQINAASERAAGLTQSLLAFSRKQVIHPSNIDLNAVIQKTENFLSRIIGEDIALGIHLSSEPLMIFADPIQIELVLMNLATNARDAMPKGGSLLISTEHFVMDTPPRDGSALQPGSYALLSVADTGTGMDKDTQAKIFEPFFTTKEVGKGTGLGLAIVYGVVKQNNGVINIDSETGEGTAFRFYFPLVAAPEKAGQPALPLETVRGGTETILLVEDDNVIRELLHRVLADHGYAVLVAEDGEQAINMFNEQRDRIQMIITDVIMPRKSGYDLIDEARKVQPDIKVIFTSGYPSDFIAKEGVLISDTTYIAKPTTPQLLLQKVREVLDSPPDKHEASPNIRT